MRVYVKDLVVDGSVAVEEPAGPFPGEDPSRPTPLIVTPPALDFGVHKLNTSARSQVVRVTNPTGSSLTFRGFHITGAPYSVISHTCPAMLASGATCQANVTFRTALPGSIGGTLSAVVEGYARFDVSLSGVGAVEQYPDEAGDKEGESKPSPFRVSPTMVVFDDVFFGTSSRRSVVVTNTSEEDVTFGTVQAVGRDFAALPASTCKGALAAGASCVVELSFTPIKVGARNGLLDIVAKGHLRSSVALSGSAVANPLEVSPGAFAFGEANRSLAPEAVVTLSNKGTGTVPFLIPQQQALPVSLRTTCPASIPASTSCTVTARLQASVALGELTSSISLRVNERNLVIPVTAFVRDEGLDVSTASIAFGNVTLGDAAQRSISVLNTGNIVLPLNGMTLPESATAFNSETSCGTSLAPGASCSVSFVFKPVAYGAASTEMKISFGTNATERVVRLSGTGTAPELDKSAAVLDFGTTDPGVSAQRSVTLSNPSNAAVTGVVLAVTGDGFSLLDTTCGTSLAAKASCDASIALTSSAFGDHAGALNWSYPGKPAAENAVALSGAVAGPQAQASVATLTFSPLAKGETSEKQIVGILNTGVAPLAISKVVVSGSAAADFNVEHSCATVAPGAACAVSVAVAPSTYGARAATLVVSHNAPGSATQVALNATGQAAYLQMSPSTFEFGGVPRGAAAAMTFTVTNKGNLPAAVPQLLATGALNVQHNCATLAAGQGCTGTVSFETTATGVQAGELRVSSKEQTLKASATVNVLGAVMDMSVPAGVGVRFGLVETGTTATQKIAALNTGNAPLTITSVALSGATAFDAQHSCARVAPGDSCVLSFSFNPTQIKAYEGVLTLTFEDGGSQKYPMRGEGAGASFVLSPEAVNREAVVPGTELVQAFTLANSGNLQGVVQSVTLTGAEAAGGTCTQNVTVAPGKSCTVLARVPTAVEGQKTATLSIATTGAAYTATLTAEVKRSQVRVQEGSVIDWGNQAVNSMNTQVVTLVNEGPATTVTDLAVAGAKFQREGSAGACPAGSTFRINADSTCTFIVTYRPTAISAADTGSVAFRANGETTTVELKGAASNAAYSLSGSPSAVTAIQSSVTIPNLVTVGEGQANQLFTLYVRPSAAAASEITASLTGSSAFTIVKSGVCGMVGGCAYRRDGNAATITRTLDTAYPVLELVVQWTARNIPADFSESTKLRVTVGQGVQTIGTSLSVVGKMDVGFAPSLSNASLVAPAEALEFNTVSVNQGIDSSNEYVDQKVTMLANGTIGKLAGTWYVTGSPAFSLTRVVVIDGGTGTGYPGAGCTLASGSPVNARCGKADPVNTVAKNLQAVVRFQPTVQGLHTGTLTFVPMDSRMGARFSLPLRGRGGYETRYAVSSATASTVALPDNTMTIAPAATSIHVGGSGGASDARVVFRVARPANGKLAGVVSLSGSSTMSIVAWQAISDNGAVRQCSFQARTTKRCVADDSSVPGSSATVHLAVTVRNAPVAPGEQQGTLTFTPDEATGLTPSTVRLVGSGYNSVTLRYLTGASDNLGSAKEHTPGAALDFGRVTQASDVNGPSDAVTRYVFVAASGSGQQSIGATVTGNSEFTVGPGLAYRILSYGWDGSVHMESHWCNPPQDACLTIDPTRHATLYGPPVIRYAITFKPTKKGVQTATLTLANTGEPNLPSYVIPLTGEGHNDVSFKAVGPYNAEIGQSIDFGTTTNNQKAGITESSATSIVRFMNNGAQGSVLSGEIQLESPTGAFTLTGWGRSAERSMAVDTACAITRGPGSDSGALCVADRSDSTTPYEQRDLLAAVQFQAKRVGEDTATLRFTPHPRSGLQPWVRTIRANSVYNVTTAKSTSNSSVQAPADPMVLPTVVEAGTSSSSSDFVVMNTGTVGRLAGSFKIEGDPSFTLTQVRAVSGYSPTGYECGAILSQDARSMTAPCIGADAGAAYSNRHIQATVRYLPTERGTRRATVTFTPVASSGLAPLTFNVSGTFNNDRTAVLSHSLSAGETPVPYVLPTRGYNRDIDGSTAYSETVVYLKSEGTSGRMTGTFKVTGDGGIIDIGRVNLIESKGDYAGTLWDSNGWQNNVTTPQLTTGTANSRPYFSVALRARNAAKGTHNETLTFTPHASLGLPPVSMPVQVTVTHNNVVTSWSSTALGAPVTTVQMDNLKAGKNTSFFLVPSADALGKLGGTVSVTGSSTVQLVGVRVVNRRGNGAVYTNCGLADTRTSGYCVAQDPSSGSDYPVIEAIVRSTGFDGPAYLNFFPAKGYGSAVGQALE